MKVSILLLLTVAGFTAANALDLTPINGFRELEGVRIPVISFDDGQRRVNWQPPEGWQLSGGGDQLHLYPEKIPLAAILIKLLPHDAAQAPANSAVDDLLKWAMNFVPGDATNLSFDHETSSPFLLDGKPSRELTFNYVSAVRKCSTSIGVVNLDEKLSIAVVLTARVEDFRAIHAAGTRSMFHWDWVRKSLPGLDTAASIETLSKAKTLSRQ